MSTATRRVRIMAGESGLLSGAHVRPHTVRRLDPQRDLWLVQPAAVAGAAVAAVADAGEV